MVMGMHIPNDIEKIASTPRLTIFSAKVSTKTRSAAGQGYSPLKSTALSFSFSDVSTLCLCFPRWSNITCNIEKNDKKISRMNEKPSRYIEVSFVLTLIAPATPLNMKAKSRAIPPWLKAKTKDTHKGSKK